MTTGPVAAAGLCHSETVTGGIWPHTLSFLNCSIPRILGNLVTVPGDTQAPSPGIPGYPAKAGNRWLAICCPRCRTAAYDLVPMHTCVWCEHMCCTETAHRRQEMRHSY